MEKKAFKHIFHSSALLFLVLLTSCYHPAEKKKDQQKSMPSIDSLRLTDLKGNVLDPSAFKGRAVFLSYWATWCKPCMEEMPSIAKAAGIMKNDNVVFLLASEESSEEIARFNDSTRHELQFAKIESFEAAGIIAIPTTVIYDLEGRIIFSEAGARKWNEEQNLNIIRKACKLD